jgi:hypothetical protein
MLSSTGRSGEAASVRRRLLAVALVAAALGASCGSSDEVQTSPNSSPTEALLDEIGPEGQCIGLVLFDPSVIGTSEAPDLMPMGLGVAIVPTERLGNLALYNGGTPDVRTNAPTVAPEDVEEYLRSVEKWLEGPGARLGGTLVRNPSPSRCRSGK